MCGLAGYNICLEEAKKLGDSGAAKLAEIGWEYNLHRGTHAHGYMTTYDKALPNPDDEAGKFNPLWWYKCPGLATNSIKSGSLPPGAPINMALHTRDYTKGTPTVNQNNHPVNVGRSYVTHNGGIDNHEEIKKKRGGGRDLADVDSIVLPLMLNEVKDPFNEDEVKACIDDMASMFNEKSAYTFHAMWTDAPGLSVLAMGKDRPLIVAWHPDRKIFVYASEKDAVTEMLKVFNIDPKDSDLLTGDLDDGKAVAFLYGEPIWQHSFTPRKKVVSTHSAPTLARYLPDGQRIDDNGGWNHYTAYSAPYSSRVATNEQKLRFWELNDDDKDAPNWWRTDKTKPGPWQVRALSHAFDKIIVHTPFRAKGIQVGHSTNGVAYYAWRGDIEYVFDDTGKLKDIIDWPVYDYEAKEPWLSLEDEIKNAINEVGDEVDFDTWLVWSSLDARLPENAYKQPPKASKVVFLPDGGTEVFPQLLKTAHQRNNLVRSAVDNTFVFPTDSRCGEHGNVLFSKHPKPDECANTMQMAKMLLCSVDELEDMEKIYPEVRVVETGSDSAHSPTICKFTPETEAVIRISDKNISRFMISEACKLFGCTKKRELYEYPNVASIAMRQMVEAGEHIEEKGVYSW